MAIHDDRVFESIQAGDISGIFQLLGATTTRRLTELVPQAIEDLAFAAALESIAMDHDGTIGQLVEGSSWRFGLEAVLDRERAGQSKTLGRLWGPLE